jgi:hypothetical protein
MSAERCAAIGVNFTGIERNFGKICGMALRVPKSPMIEPNFATTGVILEGIAGIGGTIAAGTAMTGTVIAAGMTALDTGTPTGDKKRDPLQRCCLERRA